MCHNVHRGEPADCLEFLGDGTLVEALAVVEPNAPVDVREALLSVVHIARVAG